MEEAVWIIGADGLPTNTEFIDIPTNPMEKPYPKAVWRIDSTFNNVQAVCRGTSCGSGSGSYGCGKRHVMKESRQYNCFPLYRRVFHAY